MMWNLVIDKSQERQTQCVFYLPILMCWLIEQQAYISENIAGYVHDIYIKLCMACLRMPLSMRKQARLAKNRHERDERERIKREKATEYLRSVNSTATAVKLTGISRSTGDCPSKALKLWDDSQIKKLLDPANNRAEGRPVLDADEERMFKKRLT